MNAKYMYHTCEFTKKTKFHDKILSLRSRRRQKLLLKAGNKQITKSKSIYQHWEREKMNKSMWIVEVQKWMYLLCVLTVYTSLLSIVSGIELTKTWHKKAWKGMKRQWAKEKIFRPYTLFSMFCVLCSVVVVWSHTYLWYMRCKHEIIITENWLNFQHNIEKPLCSDVQLLMETMQFAIKCKRHVWLAIEDYELWWISIKFVPFTQNINPMFFYAYIILYCMQVHSTQLKETTAKFSWSVIFNQIFLAANKPYNATPNSCFRLRILLAADICIGTKYI